MTFGILDRLSAKVMEGGVIAPTILSLALMLQVIILYFYLRGSQVSVRQLP